MVFKNRLKWQINNASIDKASLAIRWFVEHAFKTNLKHLPHPWAGDLLVLPLCCSIHLHTNFFSSFSTGAL